MITLRVLAGLIDLGQPWHAASKKRIVSLTKKALSSVELSNLLDEWEMQGDVVFARLKAKGE
ncbi:hypothetical protein CJO80_27205 (plasmid) [Ralstonia solanacearum]|nr:hypothetical protein CJO80_27205 [Ralstonia solanacearum]